MFSAACARDTAPTLDIVDHDLQGLWTQSAPGSPPGNDFVMEVTESSGAVAGTGNFAGEAGPFGVLVISGTVARDTVQLQVIYNFDPQFTGLHPDTAQFSGVLSAVNTISGTLVRGGASGAVTYVRITPR